MTAPEAATPAGTTSRFQLGKKVRNRGQGAACRLSDSRRLLHGTSLTAKDTTLSFRSLRTRQDVQGVAGRCGGMGN